MSIQIRKAKPVDAENIAALGICVWIDTYATAGLRDALSNYVLTYFTPAHIRELLSTRTVLVAELSDHLVAFAMLIEEEDVTEIDNFYVLPNFQGRGIGKEIIHKILAAHSRLRLTCWERNELAIGFYKAIGFIEDGESYFDLNGETFRNVILKKSI